MSDQDIIDTIAAHRIQTAWHGKHDGWWECTCQGGENAVPWTPEHVLTALRERYAVVERPEPREVTVLKNAWWLDGDVTAVVGSGRVRCELEDHRLSSDEARALAAVLLAAAAEADQ